MTVWGHAAVHIDEETQLGHWEDSLFLSAALFLDRVSQNAEAQHFSSDAWQRSSLDSSSCAILMFGLLLCTVMPVYMGSVD